MEFIRLSPNVLARPGVLTSVACSERHVKLSPIVPQGRSPVLTTDVSPQANEKYPTPVQIFEEIGCHLALWLTLALLANLLLKPAGI
jgi:hypothetical protein